MKTVTICLILLACLYGLSQTTFVRDVRNYTQAIQTKPTTTTRFNDEAYRACLRRKSTGVGVANLNQIQQCKESTNDGI